jgi:hypothetical protein
MKVYFPGHPRFWREDCFTRRDRSHQRFKREAMRMCLLLVNDAIKQIQARLGLCLDSDDVMRMGSDGWLRFMAAPLMAVPHERS